MNDLPLVTIALFTYNQKDHVATAVASVLEQKYSPLEVIISDDCSSDNTFEIIQNLVKQYKGSAQIKLNQNSINLGVISHVNKVVEMAKGDFIVMAAGDDISMPYRTEFLVNAWLKTNKAACSIFTNAIIINDIGNQLGTYYKTPKLSLTIDEFIKKKTCWVGGFSQGFSKQLYIKYGPITKETFQEDGALSFRALLNAGIQYLEEPTVFYRRHDNNTYDIDNYAKVQRLYQSELGLAKGRLVDLEKHSKLTAMQRNNVQVILNKNVRDKLLFVNFPILIRFAFLTRRLKNLIRAFIFKG